LEKGLHCRYLASGLPDPKADRRPRPLGIATVEDKILWRNPNGCEHERGR
jgi:hypothetical protein